MSTAVAQPILAQAAPRARVKPARDGLVIALIVAVQLVYFTGVVSTDDVGYMSIAWLVRDGGMPTNFKTNQLIARFTMWTSLLVASVVAPAKPWVMALPSMVSALAVLLILRSFARRYLGSHIAAVVMLGFGLVPLSIVLASVALPEMVATAFAWGAVYLAAGPLLQRDALRAGWRCLAAGLLIGVAYNAKETVALFGPGLILFVILCRPRAAWAWQRVGLLTLGAGVWLAFEAILTWHWTGDPLFHLHVLGRSQRAYTGPIADRSWADILRASTDYLRWLADPRSIFAPIGILLLAGVGHAFVRRSPFCSLLLCVVMPALIYLSVGSNDLRHYHPVIHQPRYLLPVLPGMALLAGRMIRRIWQGGSRRRQVVALAGVLVVALSLKGPNQLAGRWYQARTFNAGYDLIAGQVGTFEPGARIYTAGLGYNRFHPLPRWLDCPEVKMIWPAPLSPEEWVDKYGGSYVITTRADRLGPGRAKHKHLTLEGRSMECLSGFEHVARQEPPRDRLSTLINPLLGRPVPTEPGHAVELWRVPNRDEWSATRAADAERQRPTSGPAGGPI